MKLCYNQATTMRNSTLEKDLVLCEKYGYDLIEIRLDKLREYLESHSIDDLKAFFAGSHLKPFAFNALESAMFADEKHWKFLMDALDLFVEVGAAIGCKKVVVVPTSNVGDKTVADIREEAFRVLREIRARAPQMELALEFVGYPEQCVNTFGQAYDIVANCGLDKVGVVLDCFHFYAMNSHMDDLITADKKNIAILHIDDCEDLPVGALRDEHRLWPGDGVIPLDKIFSIIKDDGYDTMASVELFRPEYYDMDPEDCIRIGKEKSVKVLSPYWEVGK